VSEYDDAYDEDDEAWKWKWKWCCGEVHHVLDFVLVSTLQWKDLEQEHKQKKE